MMPLGVTRLLEWAAQERRRSGSIFGIPEETFYRPWRLGGLSVLGEPCGLPIGPAAGPHTQLAQNIVASYLCGARYVELKTVQVKDRLRIAKPCIDARDEGYNTEWSQELTLDESFAEYLAARTAIRGLEAWLGTRGAVVFAMSVGYDLAGIRSAPVDLFIDRMRDCRADSVSSRLYDASLAALGQGPWPTVTMPPSVSTSVTLSTMHGCPAREIEEICLHLMRRKRLHTLVKLNPTLVGLEDARSVLCGLGWDHVVPLASCFEKDIGFRDAVAMVERLREAGRREGVGFGVKLSNTLGVANPGGPLPGDEMYLSGRALAPLTLLAAARLADALGPELRISYSGGASERNVQDLLRAGLRPVTAATELLKPGGYLRLGAMACAAEEAAAAGLPERLDPTMLRRLADEARESPLYRKGSRARGAARIGGRLPVTDCVAAPCVSGCPVGQRVPEYIRLLAGGRAGEALDVIRCSNALPATTGSICDHPCMEKCARIDYEGPVLIRDMKRIAVSRGRSAAGAASRAAPSAATKGRVAVIGAGPSGLAAATFLARRGVAVTVFEERDRPGGVLSSVLPRYRMPPGTVEADVAEVERLGVELRYGAQPGLSIADLRSQGFAYVYVATGAGIARSLPLEGEAPLEARAFLEAYNSVSDAVVSRQALGVGRRVAVVGGGNTAMDAARTARRLRGVDWVGIVYRRSPEEMPADREELDRALAEGVEICALLAPASFRGGVLRCRRMALGERGEDGRRVAVPTGAEVDLAVDTLVSAVGESADAAMLRGAGLEVDDRGAVVVNPATQEASVPGVFAGGDAVRGGGTVVLAMADARRAADEIARRLGATETPAPQVAGSPADPPASGGRLIPSGPARDDEELVRRESSRCLSCDLRCNRCVEVCPNRANIAIPCPGFRDRTQIVHLDALCNECGLCATFCLYDGLPYRDKLTLYDSAAAFGAGASPGFVADASGRGARLRASGREIVVVDGKPVSGQELDSAERAALGVLAIIVRDRPYLLARRVT